MPGRVAAVAAAHPEAGRVELWFQDEARIGQKGRVTHVWYERGRRSRGVRDQRFGSADLFGAGGPERDTGCALVLPAASTVAMALFLAELAAMVPARTHAIVLLDRAGWHATNDLAAPPNLTLVPPPPYSPELNAIEKVWQYLPERYRSRRPFNDTAAIVDARCVAWNRLLAERGRTRSPTAFPRLPSCVTSS